MVGLSSISSISLYSAIINLMRIVIVSIYRPNSETGSAKVAQLTSEYLSENHDVLYLCLGDKLKKIRINANLTQLMIPSVPIKQGFAPKLTAETLNEVNNELSSFKPDIIHAHNIVFTALICLLWSRKHNVPFVITLHSQPSNALNYLVKTNLKSNSVLDTFSLSKAYTKNFFEACDLIISLNKSIDVSVASITKNVRITHIKNGIPLKGLLSLEVKKPTKDITFLFLGMYMPRKNQEYLIRVFSRLPQNYKLLLHGNKKTGAEYVYKLNKLKNKLKAKNVKIGGFIGEWSYIRTLKKTDYFVTASTKEVQSLSIIEALAAGKPVIGLANETITELITSENGLSVPLNTSDVLFAQMLLEFVETSSRQYEKMSIAARDSVQGFDISVLVKNLETVYVHTIKSHAPKTKNMREDVLIGKLIPEKLGALFEKDKETLERDAILSIFLVGTILITSIIWPVIRIGKLIKKVSVYAFNGCYKPVAK